MPQGEILRRFAPHDDNSGCSTSEWKQEALAPWTAHRHRPGRRPEGPQSRQVCMLGRLANRPPLRIIGAEHEETDEGERPSLLDA